MKRRNTPATSGRKSPTLPSRELILRLVSCEPKQYVGHNGCSGHGQYALAHILQPGRPGRLGNRRADIAPVLLPLH